VFAVYNVALQAVLFVFYNVDLEICSVLQCVAVCCSAMQCVAVCCNMLQCAAMRCNVHLRRITYKR
jgi:hypothetical protein